MHGCTYEAPLVFRIFRALGSVPALVKVRTGHYGRHDAPMSRYFLSRAGLQ